MDATDAELLAAFARNQSETAFRELVSRHLRMVFATARRMLADTHEAEEITQSVFQLLAEKAGVFDTSQPLAGWLYHTARHHALHRRRSEGRRRQREQTAFAMHTSPETPPPETGLIHELEEALDELETDERDALVLRFLEDRQLKAVGSELGVSEEAARKRVARALDRLRGIFGRRGFTASTSAITAALAAQSSIGVPASLGGSIISAVATTAALVTQTAPSTMTTLFNLKTAAAILATTAITGTSTYLVKEKEVDRLRAEQSAMTAEHARLAADQQQGTATIQLRDDQIATLKKGVADVPRLRGEIDRLNRDLEEMATLRAQNNRLKLENIRLIAEHSEKAQEEPVQPGKQWQLLEPRRLSEFTNVGSATPYAAMETILWAAVNGKYDKVVDMIHLPEGYVDIAQQDEKNLKNLAQLIGPVYGGAKLMAELSGVADGQVWLENGQISQMANEDGKTIEYANVVDFQLTGSPDRSDPSARRFAQYYFAQIDGSWKLVVPGISPKIKAAQ